MVPMGNEQTNRAKSVANGWPGGWATPSDDPIESSAGRTASMDKAKSTRLKFEITFFAIQVAINGCQITPIRTLRQAMRC